ncbi:hypothetical protein DACRYDRAFT_86200 [Dacryopinax primogenitus]|uniref:GH16 domain-containing protein n=1 Tax=Dacryopinax primogenitus (strain DJM 731) TaxID=1858805 RepID=M5GCY6_DACPD|nr:uncharacterized protein DACRYDRAFT_86200 [Dacryopinax primogenitus]EJU06505.1 hypothetical protein DACRYDRAFT_86200 [Dacryopinax primogenitus]
MGYRDPNNDHDHAEHPHWGDFKHRSYHEHDTSTSQASSSAAPTPTTATSDPPPSTTSTTSSTSPSPSSIWNLVESFTGQSFFNGFTFWDETVDGGDPTHGLVDYVGYQTAQDLGLVSINQQQHAVISVSTAAINSTVSRPSIRISTTRTFTGGLIIADIYHMPTGCGTWPSFWTCGPNWPQGGEIDIIEGIHQASINTASIHTNPGCYMPANYGASGSLLTQPPTGLDCSAADTNDAGCGLIASGQNTYGAGFNTAGGGVYAMQWDETGIYSFFFPRGTTPADITSGYPNPSSWGEPVGAWPASTCNPYQFFYNHVAIFDTTLCGDWAGAAWYGTPLGQSQNCAQITGYSDCNSYVTANGSAFAQAYWEIASVALYQKAGQGA